MRSGLLARKVGMTRVFREKGENVPVTVLQIDDLRVVAHKTEENDGYNALQIGWQGKSQKRVKTNAWSFCKIKS
jgi:large subunit ribosomal protein L3